MLRLCILLSLVLATAWQLHAQFMPQLPEKEQALIGLLESDESVFTKAKACQRLAVVGSEAAVPALQPLLGHPELAGYARTALERIPGRRAEDALVSAIESLEGEPLAGVLQSAGERKAARATEAIAKILRQENQPDAVRRAALRSLGKIGSREAAEVLVEHAGEAPSRSIRDAAAAILACARAAAQRNERSFSESLFQQVEQLAPDSAVARAARQQRLLFSSDSQHEALRGELYSESPSRFLAAIQIARQMDASVATVIAGALDSLSPDRKALALRCLADLGNPAVVDQVRPLIQSDQPSVARSAVIAAVELGHWDDAAELPEVATEDSPLARFALGELAKIGNKNFDADVVEHLSGLAAGNTALPRPAALGMIEYAAHRHLSAATQPLLTLTRSDDPALASAALRAAGATASLEDFPGLLRRLQDSTDTWSDADVSEAIQQATVRLPQDGAAEAIAQVMQGSSTPQQVELMNYLSLLGGERALQVVSMAARSDDDALVDAATRVLGQWMTADVAGTLGRLVRDLDNPKYRRRVLRGYLRVGRQLDMPADARAELAADAFQLARRDEERELAVDVVRRHPSLQGFTWLAEQIQAGSSTSPGNRAMQYRTLAAVAERVASDHPQRVRQTLQNLPLDDAPSAAAGTLRALRQSD